MCKVPMCRTIFVCFIAKNECDRIKVYMLINQGKFYSERTNIMYLSEIENKWFIIYMRPISEFQVTSDWPFCIYRDTSYGKVISRDT